MDYIVCLWVEYTSKWYHANFFICIGGSIIVLQKPKFLQKNNFKMALTCLILKISKNGLHHWIPRTFLHIFRYPTRNFKIFENPPFFSPPGDFIHKNWLVRQSQDFIMGLDLHIYRDKINPFNTTP